MTKFREKNFTARYYLHEVSDILQMGTSHISPATHILTSAFTAPLGRRLISTLFDFLLAFTMAYIIPILGPILFVVYFLCKDAFPFFNSQSIGKKLLQIKVVNSKTHQGLQGDYSASIFRSITLLIPGLNLIELVLLFSNKERLGDKWAGTTVVKE